MSRHASRSALASACGVATALTLALALLVTAAHAAPSDAWITTKAKAALLMTEGVGSLAILAINVDTTDGLVTLNGEVSSNTARANAETAVRAVDGVNGVQNFLTVAVDEPEPREEKDVAP